jgi:hypothetical protein
MASDSFALDGRTRTKTVIDEVEAIAPADSRH